MALESREATSIRADDDALDVDGGDAVEAQHLDDLDDVDERFTEPVLERHPLAAHPARDHHDLIVLDVHALDRADALREVEDLRLGEGLHVEPASVRLPYQRWIGALLEGVVDREGGSEVVAGDGQARRHPGCRSRRSHRRDASPRSARKRSTPLGPCPCPARRGALVPPTARRRRTGRGPCWRPCPPSPCRCRCSPPRRPLRSRRVELAGHGIHDEVDAVLPGQPPHLGPVGGVDLLDRESVRLTDLVGDVARTRRVVVGQHHRLQPGPVPGGAGDGLANSPDADQEDSHAAHPPT